MSAEIWKFRNVYASAMLRQTNSRLHGALCVAAVMGTNDKGAWLRGGREARGVGVGGGGGGGGSGLCGLGRGKRGLKMPRNLIVN